MVDMQHPSVILRVGGLVSVSLTGVYLTLVCLAASCMWSRTDAQHGHEHVGHHHSQHSGADTRNGSLLCAWACQAATSTGVAVEPFAAPVFMAQAVPSQEPEPIASASLFSLIFSRGPLGSPSRFRLLRRLRIRQRPFEQGSGRVAEQSSCRACVGTLRVHIVASDDGLNCSECICRWLGAPPGRRRPLLWRRCPGPNAVLGVVAHE